MDVFTLNIAFSLKIFAQLKFCRNFAGEKFGT